MSRGQILLDGRPLTQAMFNQCCAYVGHRADLIPSLSVQQTLHYAANLSIGSQVSGYVKDSRVRQVLADLALSQVARHSVEALTEGEYRRLVIGTQLVKDPGKCLTMKVIKMFQKLCLTLFYFTQCYCCWMNQLLDLTR